MKIDQQPDPTKTGFLQTVSAALAHLKQQLQRDYEKTYPELRDIIHLVLDQEETNAWKLTLFPHLLLPDLVEVHVARLNLQPANRAHRDMFAPHDSPETYQPDFAMCA
jgi:hypothetical protein